MYFQATTRFYKSIYNTFSINIIWAILISIVVAILFIAIGIILGSLFSEKESTKSKSFRYIKEIKQRNVSFAYDSGNVIVCEICKPDNFLQFRFVSYGCESEHLRQITDSERDKLKERAKELSQQGKKQREIASELGISLGSVNAYLKK